MTKSKKINLILIIVAICFIWCQSLLGKELSSRESGFFFNLLRPVLWLFFGSNEDVAHHFIRKCAHLSEYAVLGFLLVWFFSIKKTGIPVSLGCTLFTALTDETIQIFSGRGSAIPDVWIDFGGACFGAVIAILIIVLRNRSQKKKGGKIPSLKHNIQQI